MGGPGVRRRAVTLTELLIVVGLIVIALTMAVPAFSVWQSRRVQDAINLTATVLKQARDTAIAESQEIGLFFYLEPQTNSQYIWPIERDRTAALPNVYVIRDTEPFRLPKPMRVVPLSVLRIYDPMSTYWAPEQLDDEKYRDEPSDAPSTPTDDPSVTPPAPGTQYHRNFFVILFDARGLLLPEQVVHVYDVDPDQAEDGDEHPGFRTGLVVSGVNDPAAPNVIVDEGGKPINFLSADGLLVYDNDQFLAIPDHTGVNPEARRQHLELFAQPLYIQGVTGRIIKGQIPGAAAS